MNNWILLIIGLISILPLPVWAVKRANRHRPYKAVLLGVFILTGSLLYATYSSYFVAPISEYLFAAGLYGAITLAMTFVFMFFGYKNEGFTAQYEQLERDRWQAFKARPAQPAASGQDEDDDSPWGVKTSLSGGHWYGDHSYSPGAPLSGGNGLGSGYPLF